MPHAIFELITTVEFIVVLRDVFVSNG